MAADKHTKSSFLVSVSGIPGYWQTMSGGNAKVDVQKDRDGGSDRADILPGWPDYEDIELTRALRGGELDAWVDALRKKIGSGRFTITKQAVDANRVKIGKPLTYANCLLVGLEEPETDSNSTDAAPVKVTFATTGPA